MGPKKNKAAVRSQKEDSRDYLKSEGSCERAAVIDKETGVMTTTKEKAALGTQK